MQTVMRFGFALAGIVCLALGISLVAPSLTGHLWSRDDLDVSGSVYIINSLVYCLGAAPIALAIVLLRNAFARAPAASAAAAVSRRRTGGRIVVTLGLLLSVAGMFAMGLIAAALFSTDHRSDGPIEWMVNAVFALIGAVPLALGMWLTHIGEPGIAQRFRADVVALAVAATRAPAIAAGLKSALGFGVLTLLSAAAVMLAYPRGSLLVALTGLTVYSIADPVLNIGRRSWWLGAMLSSGLWVTLLLTLVAIADALQPMHEGAMVFLLPMMLFPCALVLSGIMRLLLAGWRRRGDLPHASDATQS